MKATFVRSLCLLPNSFLNNGDKSLLYVTENWFRSSLNYCYIRYAKLIFFLRFIINVINIISISLFKILLKILVTTDVLVVATQRQQCYWRSGKYVLSCGPLHSAISITIFQLLMVVKCWRLLTLFDVIKSSKVCLVYGVTYLEKTAPVYLTNV